MFKRKPKELTSIATAFDVPDGERTIAAREKVADLKGAILEIEDQRIALAGEASQAEKRLAEVTTEKNHAEALIRRVATGEDIPQPTPHQMANLIEQQARADAEVAKVRQRIAVETERMDRELEKLRAVLADAELAIERVRFEELVYAYRQAIAPAIPLAIAVRKAAARIGRTCHGEPLLLDTESDYGRQLFGATI